MDLRSGTNDEVSGLARLRAALRAGRDLSVSQASVVTHVSRDNEGTADDGELIDFRVARARQMLLAAISDLADMLIRLNAKPGQGVNFPLIFAIGRAEQRVSQARAALVEADPSAKGKAAVHR